MSTEMKRTLFLLLSIYVNFNLGVETTMTTESTAIDKHMTCAVGRTCYFKVGESSFDCNVSEDKNYRQLPFCSDGFSHVTSFIYNEFKNLKNESFLNVSGEFELTEDFTPTHILIIYNPGNVPYEGKFYLLKLSLKYTFLGKQNFQIDCLSIEPAMSVRGCVTVILLAATEENVKKTTAVTSTDNNCNDRCLLKNFSRIELKYNEKEHQLNVKVNNVSSIKSYNVSLFWNDNEQQLHYHCDGHLLWHKSSNKTEFYIPQENISGEREPLMVLENLFCVKIQWESYAEKRIFKLKDVKSDAIVRNTNSDFKKIKVGITAINANLEIELKIKSDAYCHLLHICLYSYNLTKVCTSDQTDDIRKNKTCVLQKLQEGKILELKFTHLSPGYYCAKIYPVHCNCNFRGLCNNGIYTKTVFLNVTSEISAISIAQEMPRFSENSTVLLIVIAVTFGLITMSVLLYLKFFRRRTCTGTVNKVVSVTDNELIATDWKSPKVRIFLLYSYEKSKLDEIVLKFIQILEECFFCQVVHIMNEYELDRAIIHTPSGWVLSSLHQADKVIIIESVKAYEMQQRWINSQTIEFSCNEDRIFLSGLVTLQNKQIYSNDYEQLIVVRFFFTPSSIALQDVVENCRFILPTSLPDLFFKIHRKKFINNEGHSIIFNAENLVAEWEKKSEVYSEFVKECNSIAS